LKPEFLLVVKVKVSKMSLSEYVKVIGLLFVFFAILIAKSFVTGAILTNLIVT